jgi:hypothetical protein
MQTLLQGLSSFSLTPGFSPVIRSQIEKRKPFKRFLIS